MEAVDKRPMPVLIEIFAVSLKLGLTSFGGPVAHLGYFLNEYVHRRKWLDDKSYADLVALCQFLPGPASSQVGMGIGMLRAGIAGGIAAFLGFTLPSALALALFAFAFQGGGIAESGWMRGLQIVAVAVVTQAVLALGRSFAPDRTRASIAVSSAAAVLLLPGAFTQILVLAVAGVIGLLLHRCQRNPVPSGDLSVPAAVPSTRQLSSLPISRRTGRVFLTLFFVLLASLPAAREVTDSRELALADSFYRAGSLVFGGGHVVLPLLEKEFVARGVDEEAFLAGYGAAQAVPGPLFTFASYLGAVMDGWPGAVLATAAIFLPAFLLVAGTLPYWNALRNKTRMQGVLYGVNASVVGILLAALYDPIWISTIRSAPDFAWTAVLFVLLVFWKLPPWLVVAASAGCGAVLSLM